MTELSRKVRKLRRRVYRDIPVATWNRVAEIDCRRPYDKLSGMFESGDRGVSSGGAALALWRAVSDRGLHACCYDFGFPESLTRMVTVVEVDGVLEVHDAFFNLSYPVGFHALLDCLRAGVAVAAEPELRDRKIYVADPAFESKATMRWLEAHADRELPPKNGLRRFELLWDWAAFTATSVDIEAAYRDLEIRGHPRDLGCLMLHPVAVFDGEQHHRDRAGMPLMGGRDLNSPLAALRMQAAQTNAQLSEAVNEAERLRSVTAQHEQQLDELQTALGDAARRFDAERAALSRERDQLNAKLHDTIALRAKLQAESQVLRAEAVSLTAERDGANERLSAALAEADQLRSHVDQLRAALDDTTREIASRTAKFEQCDGDRHSLVLTVESLRAEIEHARSAGAAAQLRAEEATRRADAWYIERKELTARVQLIDELLEIREALVAERDGVRERLAQAENELCRQQNERAQFCREVASQLESCFSVKFAPMADAVEIGHEVRQRIREIEVALDRVEADRDRINTELQKYTAAEKRPFYRRASRSLYRLASRIFPMSAPSVPVTKGPRLSS